MNPAPAAFPPGNFDACRRCQPVGAPRRFACATCLGRKCRTRTRRNPSNRILSACGLGLLVAGVAFALAGCHGRPSSGDALLDPANPNAYQERWPAAPEPARIGLRQSFACAADLGIRSPAWQRLAGWITGHSPDRETFVRPCGVAFDEQGGIGVTDTGTAKVWWFDRAKGEFQGWNRIGKHTLKAPVAIARAQGVFYVADSALGRVLAFTDARHVRFEIADPLVRPAGLVVDRDELFVVDSANHRIDVFGLDGQPRRRIGQRGTGPGEFNFPTHITVDPDGHLLVTDALNGRIQTLDREGHPLRVLSSPGDTSGHLSRPKGIAVDQLGHVYVADALFDNFQIFDGDGRFLLPVGRPGRGPGEFWLPSGLAASGHRILVADSYNQRVQIFEYVAASF